jgi:hypothetical protein
MHPVATVPLQMMSPGRIVVPRDRRSDGEDLDFFTAPERGHVPAARDALEAAARERGLMTERIHDSDTFCPMVIRSADNGVPIDLAVTRHRISPPPRPNCFTQAEKVNASWSCWPGCIRGLWRTTPIAYIPTWSTVSAAGVVP